MIVRLQTADHIRQTSTVQEEQGTTAAFDRARIMRFAVVDKEYATSLIFTHNRLGIFSDLLHHKSSSILSEIAPLTTLLWDRASSIRVQGCLSEPSRFTLWLRLRCWGSFARSSSARRLAR